MKRIYPDVGEEIPIRYGKAVVNSRYVRRLTQGVLRVLRMLRMLSLYSGMLTLGSG